MEVILLSNVKNVGKKYEIVNVAPGYARNFLLAKDLAEAVTKQNAKRVLDLKKKRELEAKREKDALEKAFAGAKDAVITLSRAANEEGHLYAGVTAEDLAAELSKVIGAELHASNIMLEKPLKALGEFKVDARVGEKTAHFMVVITAEEA